jgi:hypothetical protein
MSDEDIKTLELTIIQAREKVALLQSMERLSTNKDFIALVLKGYFEDEAIRLVMAKSASGMESKDNQKAVTKCIDAIGSFGMYLHKTKQEGKMAEMALVDAQLTKEEILMGKE